MARNFVTTSISLPARDALRHMAAIAGGMVGIPVSASDAIRLADLIITDHPDYVRTAAVRLGLTSAPTPEGTDQ